ncbi:MAG: hypothetical protein II397_07190 [Treponema sp.]|nr:hypothetical protein [Treponema sp.]
MIAESLRNSARRKAALPGLLLLGKDEKKNVPELVEGNISKPNPSPKTQAVTLSLTQGLS